MNNAERNIRILKTAFTKNGHRYLLLKRCGMVAMYGVAFKLELISVEVFIVRIQKPTRFIHTFHEWFPSDEKFGLSGEKAFILSGMMERADVYFKELLGRQRDLHRQPQSFELS